MEINKVREQINSTLKMSVLTASDYVQWRALANTAWKGIGEINKQWDFIALTKDNDVSIGLYDGKKLLGASLNVLKHNKTGFYLLIHMLGIHESVQNSGIGTKLMQANYALAESIGINQIKLTSDPLDSRNVNLYLRKSRMNSNEYIPEAYPDLDKEGADKQRGLPADRLYYQVNVLSEWVKKGIMPRKEDYLEIVQKYSHLINGQVGLDLSFVETPVDLEHLLKTNEVEAGSYRSRQRVQLKRLFLSGYIAVDFIVKDKETGLIVCLKDFNEHDPLCLMNAVNNLLGRRQIIFYVG